eukprot:20053-Eustigmatos_ZCMA.PRE.1
MGVKKSRVCCMDGANHLYLTLIDGQLLRLSCPQTRPGLYFLRKPGGPSTQSGTFPLRGKK